MSFIKNKIRLERFRKEMSNQCKDGNLYPNNKFFSFGKMSDEDITIEYYKPMFSKYYTYIIFINNDIITPLLNDVKYDKNHSNPIEHYELQLYRVWLIITLVLNEYEIEFVSSLQCKTVDELEHMNDELTLLKKENRKWLKF